MNKLLHIAASVAIAWLLVLPARASDITVGLITSMTGPNASIGIPYAKGTAAGVAYKDEVDGVKIRVQQLDDSSDPTTGARDAHKLIEEAPAALRSRWRSRRMPVNRRSLLSLLFRSATWQETPAPGWFRYRNLPR